jgi:hypothetical protein
MPSRTRDEGPNPRTVDELVSLVEGEERFIDLCLIFRRDLDKSYMFEIGWRWDTLEECWADEPPQTAVYVEVDESQLELAWAFWEWIQKRRAGDDDRDIILFAGGERGGGKTYFLVVILVAVAIEIPNGLCWAVSPTLDKREEIERTLRDLVPPAWRSPPHGGYRGMPDCRFMFPNGSAVRSLSGEMLGKRGEADCIGLNEAQDHRDFVFAHSLPPLRKTGGLFVAAGNAPDDDNDDGSWTVELKEALEDAGEDGIDGSYIHVDASKNSHISQVAQDKIGRALYRVVPRLAAADVGNVWRHPGRRAFPDFRPWSIAEKKKCPDGIERFGHIGDPPDIVPAGQEWLDVTREVTLKKTGGRAYDWATGGDFGKDPHSPVVWNKILKRPDGVRVYYASDELLVPGTENELAEAMIDWLDDRDIDRAKVLNVFDGSGLWQKITRDRDGNYSHNILKSYGLEVVPPRRPLNPTNTPSGSGRNPHVPDSLAQMSDVLLADRLLVSPRCTWLIESLKKCSIKKLAGGVVLDKSRDKDQFTHVTDGERYFVWFFEPKKAPRAPAPLDEKTFNELRGIRLLTNG